MLTETTRTTLILVSNIEVFTNDAAFISVIFVHYCSPMERDRSETANDLANQPILKEQC
jgi:hypothetical protein